MIAHLSRCQRRSKIHHILGRCPWLGLCFELEPLYSVFFKKDSIFLFRRLHFLLTLFMLKRSLPPHLAVKTSICHKLYSNCVLIKLMIYLNMFHGIIWTIYIPLTSVLQFKNYTEGKKQESKLLIVIYLYILKTKCVTQWYCAIDRTLFALIRRNFINMNNERLPSVPLPT